MSTRQQNTGKRNGDNGSFVVELLNYDPRKDEFVIDGCSNEANVKITFNNNEVAPSKTWKIQDGKTRLRVHIATHSIGVLKMCLPNGDSMPLSYTDTSRLTGVSRYDYRLLHGVIFIPAQASLILRKFSLTRVCWREFRFFLDSFSNRMDIRRNAIKTVIVEALRIATLVRVRFNKKEIWIFSDRAVSGADNSEVLFRYVANQRTENIQPYFVVNKDTKAYATLRRQGYRVIKFRSVKHLYMTMVASVIFPSHLDVMYLYPWPGLRQKYAGLLQYIIIHTQHGIVINDMARYIGKYEKNAQLFLSICNWEQQYLHSDDYGYSLEELPVTGAPRYDALEDTSGGSRVIALHPTWRSWLAGREHEGHRQYSRSFKESDYFNFYQRLINDPRIVAALEKHDYTLKLYLHPNHRENVTDFSVRSNNVEIMKFPYDYNLMFSESKALVTDYSNTLFDFAYLKKPVLHAQFDRDEFFIKQTTLGEGHFDYVKDGFGPVCHSYEETVEQLLVLIDDTYVPAKKYSQRIESFFTYSDQNNAQRSYDAVLHFLNR